LFLLAIAFGFILEEELIIINLELVLDFILLVSPGGACGSGGLLVLPMRAINAVVLEFALLQFDGLVVLLDEMLEVFQYLYALPTGFFQAFPLHVV
jgi:hypothetical protein